MPYKEPPRTTTPRTPGILIAGLLVLIAVVAPALGYRLFASSPSKTASLVDVIRNQNRDPEVSDAGSGARTAFDDETPDVANLDPALLQALRQAATAAADDGVTFYINSGWRSREYQDQLLREAISRYGTEEEAARWVATADTSPHVSGDALDIGHSDATSWLSKHGFIYGLCQIYRNEPWHFELRPEAIVHHCPAMYADPTHDPRMHSDEHRTHDKDRPLRQVPTR